MNREDILNYLNEPFHLLTADQIARAEQAAKVDEEIRQALASARVFSKLPWSMVLPEAMVSDGVFLTRLRESKALSKTAKGLFGGFHLGWRVVAACAVLFLVVSFGANYRATAPANLADATLQQEAENLSGWLVIAEQAAVVNPHSLATSLNVSELTEIWDDTVSDQTSETELLLTLDDESFQAVLDDLAATHFFNGNGS